MEKQAWLCKASSSPLGQDLGLRAGGGRGALLLQRVFSWSAVWSCHRFLWKVSRDGAACFLTDQLVSSNLTCKYFDKHIFDGCTLSLRPRFLHTHTHTLAYLPIFASINFQKQIGSHLCLVCPGTWEGPGRRLHTQVLCPSLTVLEKQESHSSQCPVVTIPG